MCNTNEKFHASKTAKDDEFYTPYDVVSSELDRYAWRGRRVFCPCDNEGSAFVRYFQEVGSPIKWRQPPRDLLGAPLSSSLFEVDDSFKEGLAWSDVVVTNPPFSKFRDFIDILVDSGKKFLVLGSNMACNYKNVL